MHASIPEGIATQDEQRLAWPTAMAALGGVSVRRLLRCASRESAGHCGGTAWPDLARPVPC
jgi:hypothetical protein